VDENKRNPHDFALWFTRSKFEHQSMMWDSPWGRGYPGWHIECSAMSMKYLGEQFDIHCGGVDHISVHHTNEIAQSEAASGKVWVRYWVHGEHLLMDTEKMSKSKGEFLTLETLVNRGYEPMDYRYYLLGAHYRAQLQFNFEALDAARNARKRLTEWISRMKEEVGEDNPEESRSLGSYADGQSAARNSGAQPGALQVGDAGEYLESFQKNALKDMNMPRCLSDLWGLVRDGEIAPKPKLDVIAEMDRVLGLRLEESRVDPPELDTESEDLIRKREEARKMGDYGKADELREMLRQRGITLEDTPKGVRWKRN
jgi:cysteinyl-tRNA synthetase